MESEFAQGVTAFHKNPRTGEIAPEMQHRSCLCAGIRQAPHCNASARHRICGLIQLNRGNTVFEHLSVGIEAEPSVGLTHLFLFKHPTIEQRSH